jgi:hypothetical protein
MKQNKIKWNGTRRNKIEHKFHSIVWTFYEVLYSISYTPNWRGREMRENDGIELNRMK